MRVHEERGGALPVVGEVSSLIHYPVKSVAGEVCAALDLDERGAIGDRLWAVYTDDGGIGSGKTTRRFRKVDGLLGLSAHSDPSGTPVLRFPDGDQVAVDEATASERLSAHLDRPVRLARETHTPHHDDAPLHAITTSSLAKVAELTGERYDVRRFRANLLIDTGNEPGFVEDDWLGRELQIGSARLHVTTPMPRCVMVTMAHPAAGLPAAGGLLRTLGAAHDADLGVMVSVTVPGRISVGDAVTLV